METETGKACCKQWIDTQPLIPVTRQIARLYLVFAVWLIGLLSLLVIFLLSYGGILSSVGVALIGTAMIGFIVAGLSIYWHRNVIGHTVWCFWHEGVFHVHGTAPIKATWSTSPLVQSWSYQKLSDQIKGGVLELSLGGWRKHSRLHNFMIDPPAWHPTFNVTRSGLYGEPIVRMTDVGGYS